MKRYEVCGSTDGDKVDFSTVISVAAEPGFWDMYEIAQKYGCDFFDCRELPAV